MRDQVIVWAVVVALPGMGAASREAAAQANTSAHLDVPSHIRLTPAFTEIVGEMFKRSPRFRAQWEATGVHDLRYAYETKRAYKVGQQVARECRRLPDRIGKALR